jgi:hypothetical protein
MEVTQHIDFMLTKRAPGRHSLFHLIANLQHNGNYYFLDMNVHQCVPYGYRSVLGQVTVVTVVRGGGGGGGCASTMHNNVQTALISIFNKADTQR